MIKGTWLVESAEFLRNGNGIFTRRNGSCTIVMEHFKEDGWMLSVVDTNDVVDMEHKVCLSTSPTKLDIIKLISIGAGLNA
jgi:hypothetical protein